VNDLPSPYRNDACADRLSLVAASFYRLLGHPLIDSFDNLTNALWEAPAAIVAHGIEDDPIFFFGNRMALQAFEMDAERFITTPSRLSAEPELRKDRQALLDRVKRDGFIDDYAGVRISATGQRFRIENAIVWNVLDDSGVRQGQAAMFERWVAL